MIEVEKGTEDRDRSVPLVGPDSIANNSGHEPAVGTRFHNKMSVNMATDFIKKCMEDA